jgi:uncharacterized integral membrane protein
MRPKYWFLMALMFVVIIFTIQNYAPVTIKILFWSIRTSEAILIYISLLIGVIIGAILSRPR